MEHFLCSVALFSLLILFEGCASFTPVTVDLNSGGKTISLTSNINKEYRLIRHFKKVQRIPFLFLARINPEGGAFDLREALQDEPSIFEGDAVVNAKIKGEVAIGDILFPVGLGVVGGLVFPPLSFFTAFPLFEDLKTYTVEGDIVKYVEQNPSPESDRKFDPVTGLPARNVRFDPNTGLPIKP